MKIKNNVRLMSGRRGYRCRLRDSYDTLAEYERYCWVNPSLCMDYDSCEVAWETNPWIEGSVFPSDFGRVANPVILNMQVLDEVRRLIRVSSRETVTIHKQLKTLARKLSRAVRENETL